MKDGDYLEDLSIDGNVILQQILKKENGTAWAEVIWLSIKTNGWFLLTW
jgi:hypothetical protein